MRIMVKKIKQKRRKFCKDKKVQSKRKYREQEENTRGEGRIAQFKEAVLYGAIFPCVFCQRLRFKQNVQYQTDNLNATMPSEVGKTISLSLTLSASKSTVVVESTHVLLYKSNKLQLHLVVFLNSNFCFCSLNQGDHPLERSSDLSIIIIPN